MKNFFLALTIAFFCAQLSLSAQTEKGKKLVAISSALGIGGSTNGFAFSSTKSKSDSFESDPIKSSSFNLSPRVGFFVVDNFVIGAEVFYGFAKQDDFIFQGDVVIDEVKTNTIGGGPFFRYYFQTKRVLPFVEAGLIIGTSNTSFGDLDDDKNNLLNYGGGAGIAVPLGAKVSFDAILRYSHFEIKATEDNNNNFRTISNAFSLGLGFSIYLGKAQSQNTQQTN